MTGTFRIQGMKLARVPQAAPAPRHAIASFDIDLCGIEISGCDLIRTASNGLTVRGPAGCTFVESSTRHAVMEIATRAYVALGGNDVPDWWRSPPQVRQDGEAMSEVG